MALWKCKQDHIRERQQFIYQMQNVPFLVRWKQAWITGGVHLSRAAVKPDTLPSMRVSTICGANLCSPLSPLLFHSHPPLSPPSFPHPPWVEPTLRGCALPISVSHLSLWVTGAGICWVWNWPSHFCPWTFQAPPPAPCWPKHTTTHPQEQKCCYDLKLTFMVWPPSVVGERRQESDTNTNNTSSLGFK